MSLANTLRAVSFTIALAVFASGCARCTEPTDRQLVLASEYDRSCATHEDCIVITEGDYCSCLECRNAAIAATAEDRYQADVDSAEKSCLFRQSKVCGSLEPQRTTRQATSCSYPAAVCLDGRCTAFFPDEDRLPNECSTDEDCRVVPGSFWKPCDEAIAVNQQGYDIATTIAADDWPPEDGWTPDEDQKCECVEAGPPRCVGGECQTGDEAGTLAWHSSYCR